MMKKEVAPALLQLLTELKKSPDIHGKVVTRRGENNSCLTGRMEMLSSTHWD